MATQDRITRDLEDTLFYAFRYALGRSTYAVQFVCEQLNKYWPRMRARTRRKIQVEINEALGRGEAGMNMDVEQWIKITKLEIKE